jgi:hypothetical protein
MNECWLEIDLSWFQGRPQAELVDELFIRLLPLWRREDVGRRGLVFCVGWMMDAPLGWNGDLDAAIPCCNGPNYEAWTYRRFAGLLADLRRAAAAHGVCDLRLGLLQHGCPDFSVADGYNPALRKGRTDRHDDQYGYNIRGTWFPAHPEVRDPRFDHHFWFGAPVQLPADERIWNGPQPTFGAYYAAKLTALSSAVGLDAVVLRDCILTSNCGDYRGALTMQPDLRQAWTGAIIDMLAAAKRARPDLILIGYSGYTGQLTCLRSTGFDLEAVANSGHLDLWITQSWASAFQDYWRSDTLGYLPMLINALVEQSMIADSTTRHLFLVETFDAWEPFTSLQDFPGKLDWLVQALGRSGVHLPDGTFRRPAGAYLSWMNKQATLLPERDVATLVESFTRLAAGLADDPRPLGPCLVHDRRSLLHLLDHPADHCRGEIADQWLGQIARHGTGVLSATRAEWLDRVQPDGLIWPCPADPTPIAVAALRSHLERGAPALLLGQSDAMAPAVQHMLDIAIETAPPTARFAVAGEVDAAWHERLGCQQVVLAQRRRSLAPSPHWKPLLNMLGGPVLARHANLPCWVWETPHWTGGWMLTCENLHSLQAYWLVAEATGDGWGAPRWRSDRAAAPCCVLAWRTAAGRTEALLGNLENGMVGESAHAVTGMLAGSAWSPQLGGEHVRLSVDGGSTRVLLAGHQRAILGQNWDTDGCPPQV